jgi:hypothetical protein
MQDAGKNSFFLPTGLHVYPVDLVLYIVIQQLIRKFQNITADSTMFRKQSSRKQLITTRCTNLQQQPIVIATAITA